MPVALATSGDPIAARAGMPGAIGSGWYRVRRPGGRVLVWAVFGFPDQSLITAWPSRELCEAGAFASAVVLSAVEFAAAAVPVEAQTDG